MEFSMDDVVVEEIPVSVLNDELEQRVKDDLEMISSDLFTPFDTRLKTPALFDAAYEAFGVCEEWYDSEKFSSEEQLLVLREKIDNLLKYIKESRNENFTQRVGGIVHGYDTFLTHHIERVKNQKSDEMNLEDLYASFWEHFHEMDSMNNFIELFEFIQRKSYSEAICESIRSIMNLATGTGRVLFPDNFAREIFLR